MTKWWYDFEVVCHWCGKHYKAKKGRLQARFHSNRCKQAHWRAYKKYVTSKTQRSSRAQSKRVTPKKRKK